MSLTFKELKKALDEGDNPILVLGQDRKGNLKIIRRYNPGGPHSVGRTMAKMDYDVNKHLIWITDVSAIRNSP